MASPEFDAAQAALACVVDCVELPPLCQSFVSIGDFPPHETTLLLYVGTSEIYPTTAADFPTRNAAPTGRAKCFRAQAATLQMVYVGCRTVTQNGSPISDEEMDALTESTYRIGADVREAVSQCFGDGYNFVSQTYDLDGNTSVMRMQFNLLLPAHCLVCE